MSISSPTTTDQLNDENYEEWSFKIKMHLMRENLWHIVSEPPPEISYYDNWDEKNMKAMGIIGLSLADNQLRHIKNLTKAYDVWLKLKENYEKSISGKRIILIKKLLKMHLRHNQTMEDHLSNMMEIIGKLLSYGDGFDEKFFITKMLSTLPYQYNTLIATFESMPEDELTIEYVNEKLLTEYKEVERQKKKGRQAYEDRKEKFKAINNINNPAPETANTETRPYQNQTRDQPPSYDDAINKNVSPGTSNLYPQIPQYKFAPVAPSAPTKSTGPFKPPESSPFKPPESSPVNPFLPAEQKKIIPPVTGARPKLPVSSAPNQARRPGPTTPSALQCYYCKQAGHRINECQLRMRKETVEAFEVISKQEVKQCTFCNKPGHTKDTCAALARCLTQCGFCNQTGHTRQNCKLLMAKQQKKSETECVVS